MPGTDFQHARHKKAKASGVVAVGYRDASIPFSYVTGAGEPIGYSIDLCKMLVDAIGEAVGRDLAIKWVPVTSDAHRGDHFGEGGRTGGATTISSSAISCRTTRTGSCFARAMRS